MSRICTICVRGGSKGVEQKNLRIINGLPLIAHTVNQAVNSNQFSHIAVSSDDDEILKVAESYGAQFLIQRPPELASDTAPKVPAIRHCMLEVERLVGKEFPMCVDLDATAPCRNTTDIANCIELFEKNLPQNVISGARSRHSPYFNMVELTPRNRVKISKDVPSRPLRRQDSPEVFDLNGSIYIWRRDSLMQFDTVMLEDTLLYEMSELSAYDIDSELDFKIVEFLLREHFPA